MTALRTPKVFESRDKLEFVDLLDGVTHYKDVKLQPGDVIVGADKFCYVYPYVMSRAANGISIETEITDLYKEPLLEFYDVFKYFRVKKHQFALWVSCNHPALLQHFEGDLDTRWKRLKFWGSNCLMFQCEFTDSLTSRTMKFNQSNLGELLRCEYLQTIEPSSAIVVTKSKNYTFIRRASPAAIYRVSLLTTQYTEHGKSEIVKLGETDHLYIVRGTCSSIERVTKLDLGNDAKILKVSRPDHGLDFDRLMFGADVLVEYQIGIYNEKIAQRRKAIVDIALCFIPADVANYPILWIIDQIDCFKYDEHKWKVSVIYGVFESIQKVYRRRERKQKKLQITK